MNADSIIREITQLKSSLEEAGKEKSRKEGILQASMKRLKDDYSISSEEKGDEEINKMKKEETENDNEIEKTYLELKEEYSW